MKATVFFCLKFFHDKITPFYKGIRLNRAELKKKYFVLFVIFLPLNAAMCKEVSMHNTLLIVVLTLVEEPLSQ
jgi:hypothetical protein